MENRPTPVAGRGMTASVLSSCAHDSGTDVEILAGITAGRLEAFEVLYDRYRLIAYSIALRITADPTAAEDVVQDAFISAWRNAARYVEARGSVKTWLLAIVHHRAVDAIRRRRPTTELPAHEAAPTAAFTLPDVWPEVVARLDASTARAALATLSAGQRTALEMAYFGGLTQREIADRTGTPLGTVKSRMRLGLLALRRHLREGPGLGPTDPGPLPVTRAGLVSAANHH